MDSGGSIDETGTTTSGMTRRSMLAKAGVGIGVAWAAPTILSKPAFAAGSCTNDAITWSNFIGSLNNGPAPAPFTPFTINIGVAASVLVSFDGSSDSSGSGTSTFASTVPLGGSSDFVELSISSPNAGDFIEISFTFDVPVNNLAFQVLDVDQGAGFWQDQVTLFADLGGTPVAAAVAAPSIVTHTANPTNDVLTANTDPTEVPPQPGVPNNTSAANVAVAYVGSIDHLVIRFGPANATDLQTHQVGISGMVMCVEG